MSYAFLSCMIGEVLSLCIVSWLCSIYSGFNDFLLLSLSWDEIYWYFFIVHLLYIVLYAYSLCADFFLMILICDLILFGSEFWLNTCFSTTVDLNSKYKSASIFQICGVKSSVCFDSVPGLGAASKGHCWIDCMDTKTSIRYWSVHKLAVVEKEMARDESIKLEQRAIVGFWYWIIFFLMCVIDF